MPIVVSKLIADVVAGGRVRVIKTLDVWSFGTKGRRAVFMTEQLYRHIIAQCNNRCNFGLVKRELHEAGRRNAQAHRDARFLDQQKGLALSDEEASTPLEDQRKWWAFARRGIADATITRIHNHWWHREGERMCDEQMAGLRAAVPYQVALC
jgi:hypothetical protein